MKRHNKPSRLLAIASVALLASASSASAAEVSVEAGPLVTGVDSDALVQQGVGVLGSATGSTVSSARLAYRNRLGQRRARRIRARALRRANTLMANALASQHRAVSRARSSTGGAYALVAETGRILDQSGGMLVGHPAVGVYVLTFATQPGCGTLSGGLPFRSALGNLSLSGGVGGAITVFNRSAGGTLRDGGFYLAASC
jgi:hypothetical protein